MRFVSFLFICFCWICFIPTSSAQEQNQETVLQGQNIDTPFGQGVEGQDQTEEMPFGQEISGQEEGVGGDIFSRKGGYIHPFLSLTETYSDNVFRSNDNEQSGFGTIISPGVWLAVPRIKERDFYIDTSTFSPSGTRLSHETLDYFDRYQFVLRYQADIEINSHENAQDVITHALEGLFQLNLRSGLSFDLIDKFEKKYDSRGSGTSLHDLNKYNSNLINLVMTAEINTDLTIQVNYANFVVAYDGVDNEFKERVDNSIGANLSYQIGPETEIFAEYEYVVVGYDKVVTEDRDSTEHHMYGGIKKELTEKTSGLLKAGYGIKEFDSSAFDSQGDYILEAQAKHKFTTKSQIALTALRKTRETDIDTSDYVLTHSFEATYSQQINNKITAHLLGTYRNEKFKDKNGVEQRDDDDITISPQIQYEFTDWLTGEIGYSHSFRNSTNDFYDFTENLYYCKLFFEL